jgi:hypothetical protein
MADLYEVMKDLARFFDHADQDAMELLKQDFKLPMEDILDFIDQKGPYILSGEISKSTLGTGLSEAAIFEDAASLSRLDTKDADIYDKPLPEPGDDAKTKMTLQSVLDAIHKFWTESRAMNARGELRMQPVQHGPVQPANTEYRGGGKNFRPYVDASKNLKIDLDKVVALAFDSGKSRKDIDAGIAVWARSHLRHELFKHPEKLKDVFKDATPEKIFGNVDGVILTRQGGYLMIPKEKLNDTLYFDSVTKMNARLKLKKGRF